MNRETRKATSTNHDPPGLDHSGPGCVCALGLGANLGDRAATLHAAVDALRGDADFVVLAVSAFRETAPVGPADQPAYLNGAVLVRTTLAPRDVLDRLLGIERTFGRDRSREARWGARTLDLDLLLYGDRVIDEPGLTVPHPRMLERLFVLEPLNEIGPDLVVPAVGARGAVRVSQSLAELRTTSVVSDLG